MRRKIHRRNRRKGEVIIFIAIMCAMAVTLLGALVFLGLVALSPGPGGNGGGGAPVDGMIAAEEAAKDAVQAGEDSLADADAAYQAALQARARLEEAGENRYGAQKSRLDLQQQLEGAEGEERERLEEEIATANEEVDDEQKSEDDAVLAYERALEELDQALAALDGAILTAEDAVAEYEDASVEAQREAAREAQEGDEENPLPAGDPIDSSLDDQVVDLKNRLVELQTNRDSEFPPAEEILPEQLEGLPEDDEELDPTADTSSWVVVVAQERATEGVYVRRWVVLEGEVLEWDREDSDARSAEEFAADTILRLKEAHPEAWVKVVKVDGADEAPSFEVGKPLELYGESTDPEGAE